MTDRRLRSFLLAGVAVTILVAVGVSQVASSSPDGLEHVAEQQGFADTATEHGLAGSPLADYGEGLTGNGALDTAIAGFVGVVVTLAVGWVVLTVLRRRRTATP